MPKDFTELVKAFEFGSTYPVATVPAQPAGPGYGAAPTSNLQQLVMDALQGVLGRSFKPGDYQSFRAALEVSFEYKQVSGQPVYQWKPRAYPAVGSTDIGGGVSGAQYSLVTFANSLHGQTKPLLDGLHSLDAGVDEEELKAAKAIFSTAWDELVDELSREGGPRASRADALARGIFDPTSPEFQKPVPNLELVGSLIRLGVELDMIKTVTPLPGTLGGKIEFDRSKIVTSDEEGYLTNYIALTDYYFAVAQAWQNYRATFLGKDLGSGLFLIERALAVVEDGVNEVYVAMDSVNVDQSERLVIPIGFPPPDENLTVEDFLSWIASFASREAPEVIREGGKRGLEAIIPTADKLRALTVGFVKLVYHPPKGGPRLPRQFKHSRVLNPLDELARYLETLVTQANSITK